MTKINNETKTRRIVNNELSRLGYTDNSEILIEEERSDNLNIRNLLKNASKNLGTGGGRPDFIISSSKDTNFVIVIECKPSTSNHKSGKITNILEGVEFEETEDEKSKRLKQYAVDGCLYYAEYLSKGYNVIAIAVSGESKNDVSVDSYLWPKKSEKPKQLKTKENNEINDIIPWDDYINNATFDPYIQKIYYNELMSFASELHDFMREHAKLSENEKPLVVSGTLLALKNEAFRKAYDSTPVNRLQKLWMRTIKDEIDAANIPSCKKDSMIQPYSSISVHAELGKPTIQCPKGPLYELIKLIEEKIHPFMNSINDIDIVGQFYGEFLKYTGGDKKSLGIVLTPKHITELFSLLTNVNKNSKVLDICTGTGGFLISAMYQMFKSTLTNEEREIVKKDGLVGVEQQPNMFALAASNMILRGDGKANLYQGSCFDDAITKAIKEHQCDVGMINPPYSQIDTDLHELKFIEHMLNCLKPGGVGIAIVPMSCTTGNNNLRTSLLKKHTLEAVMSMPDQLFYPVGTVTCIMVFTANKPHSSSAHKTWFGYWKNDGFIKTKHKGRLDLENNWEIIRNHWVSTFHNRETIINESVTKEVDGVMEWCPEAYLETDYSALSISDFEKVVKNYVIYKLSDTEIETICEDNIE